MRTEQEVLAYLYRKRDGALSGATRVVYAEVISAIEGDFPGESPDNAYAEVSTPRRFDDRAVNSGGDAPAADHRGRPGGSDLWVAVRNRRHLGANSGPSADQADGVPPISPKRYGYGESGHEFDSDRRGRCRKANAGYCDGTRLDPSHDERHNDSISGPVAELLLKGATDEQIAEVEALQRTFQERRRFAPVAAPTSRDGGQAA